MAIDGTYKGIASSMLGSAEAEITLKQEGDVLTGRASAVGLSDDIKDGKVKGNHITGNIEANSIFGKSVVAFEATIEGDTLKGSLKYGPVLVKVKANRVQA